MPDLDPKTTALVLIDLQKGIMGYPLAPNSAADVVKVSTNLAQQFRQAGAPVVLVNVVLLDTGVTPPPVDRARPRPAGGYPPDFSEFVADLQKPGDFVVTKHTWGAFHNTKLDDILRQLGVKTIVLGGIATNMGVESTARQAHERGYGLVIVNDAMSSMSQEMHDFAVTSIFPSIARVVVASDIKLN